MVYQLKNTSTNKVCNLDVEYDWSKIFKIDTPFVITQMYRYKYQFARYFRQCTGCTMAYADDISRTIYEFCGNDETILCNSK